MPISPHEFDQILDRCKGLPPAKGMYLEHDYMTNLFLTVLDFQMHIKSLEMAIDYYKTNRWDEVRTLDDLNAILSEYPDDEEGNSLVAKRLWNNRHWTRVSLLRKLVGYFQSIGVTSQQALSEWAKSSDYKQDFEGRIPGMAYAIYQWLIMRQGVETVKPDVHVRHFVESTIGRSDVTDEELVRALEEVARILSLKAYELDWSIWEYEKGL